MANEEQGRGDRILTLVVDLAAIGFGALFVFMAAFVLIELQPLDVTFIVVAIIRGAVGLLILLFGWWSTAYLLLPDKEQRSSQRSAGPRGEGAGGKGDQR